MTTKHYMAVAVASFLLIVTGSDVFARMTIANEAIGVALSGHLEWVYETSIGIIFLFLPFGASAVTCGRANKRARERSTATIFFVALTALGYFYFEGFQAAEHAVLARKWTAAALSVGLLPFFIGIPIYALVELFAFIAVRIDHRLT